MLSNLKYRDLSAVSLRKQPTSRDATTGFPAKKWRLRNEGRNSILKTRHYPALGSASDWLNPAISHAAQPIRSTTRSPNVICFLRLVCSDQVNYLRKVRKWLSWILDFLSRKLGFRIPVDKLYSGFQSPAFPGSTNKSFPDCGFGEQKFSGFWNPEYITCGNARNKAPEYWVCLSYIKLPKCYKQS